VPELSGESGGLDASVIVPVRNGRTVLPGLIAALQRQSYSPDRFEIIIGDDGSDDGGTDSLEALDPRVRVSRGPAMTGYAARNRAARLAHAPVLAFCDADCVPEPDWLEAGLAAIEQADVVGGFIHCVSRGRESIWTLIDVDTFVDAERAIRNGGLLTGNLFVRRELFTRLGGFDETLPRTGDFEFSRRARDEGARIAFSRAAAVSHPTYDKARPFLGKFWSVNRWFGWREGRAGRRPFLMRLRAWVPVVQTLRSRQASGKPVGLDLPRLHEHGFDPGRRQELQALPIIYLLLPYTACVGQTAGWLAGRGRRDGARSRGSGLTDGQ
jgi:GT2 family glycosyltransferase